MKIIFNKSNLPQMNFFNSKSRALLFLAGRGSGKSFGGALKAVKHIVQSGSVGMIVAPSYRQLAVAQNVLWDIFWNVEYNADEERYFKSLQRDKSQPLFVRAYNKQENDLETTFGSMVHFRSGNEPDALRGYNLNWCWLEEPALMSKEVLMNIKLTLRREPNDIPNQYWLTTTPKGFNWLYDELDNLEIHTATTFDNKHNLPAEFLNDLPTDGTWYEQEVLGKFVELDGLVFNHYVVDDVTEIDRYVYGLDFGYTSPTALVKVGLKGGDTVYVEEGWEATHLTTNDIFQKIFPFYQNEPVFADPALPSNIEDLRRLGLFITPANNDILYGIDVIKRCTLVISPKVVELLEQLKTYSWDVKRGKPVKGYDHSIDAMRYAIVGLMRQKPVTSNSMAWFSSDKALYERIKNA